MGWTVAFTDVGREDVALVGGKAANLGEMTRAGLPVPPGFCVTADAYRAFVGTGGTTDAIRAALESIDPQDAIAVEAAAAEIRQLLTARPMPDEIAAAVAASYAALVREVGASGQTSFPVAVRSSATAEDLPDASFAGQQDTYLNVHGEDALLEHVRRCWASLWTARAVTYRARQGYEHEQVALAVAVQAMVAADVAGVLFTADPLTSDRQTTIINASYGLGEAIVSGIVTPDTWHVDKHTRAIRRREIGHKERQVVRLSDGGTEEIEVPTHLRDAPSLSDEQVAELAVIGARIEDHYAQPMDVEWAYSGGRAYMLQARPITTLHEAPSKREPVEPGDYNRTMFIEIFPDPLSPAFVSVVEPLFTGMLDFTFRTLGFRPPNNIRGVAIFHSQPYFNQRYIEAAFAPLRPATRAAFVARIVNPFGRERGAPLELSVPFLRMGWRLLRLMRSLHRIMPREVTRYRAEIAAVERLRLHDLPEKELVDRIVRLVFEAANRLLNYDFLLIALVSVTYQALGRLLEPYFGEETEELRGRLISGVTGNVTMETNKRLWDLAQVARASDVVSNELRRGGEPGELRERLSGSVEGAEFLTQLDAFLAEYGHRELRMDILYPTWVEDPVPVFAFVRGYLETPESSNPHRQEERLAAGREQLAVDVRQRVRRDLRGRLLVWPVFDWVLRHTQANTRHRDTMHFELTRMFPPFRHLLLELGARWAERGVLDTAEDVFFLSFEEMRQAADSSDPLVERVADRRRQLDAHRSTNPPPIIRDGIPVWTVGEHTEHPDGAAGGAGLHGVAGSPGRVTGRVRVVRGPEGFASLGNGEILVAPLTNPVWTPLFAVAGGLVTEVGGILSHGAIVAREYGIPAVMAVPGATSVLHDGQLVTVDGSRGTVELVGAPTASAVADEVATDMAAG